MHVISGPVHVTCTRFHIESSATYTYVAWIYILKNESQSHGLGTICVQMFVDVYVFCEYRVSEDLSDFIFAKS